MEGARWDESIRSITDSLPKQVRDKESIVRLFIPSFIPIFSRLDVLTFFSKDSNFQQILNGYFFIFSVFSYHYSIKKLKHSLKFEYLYLYLHIMSPYRIMLY